MATRKKVAAPWQRGTELLLRVEFIDEHQVEARHWDVAVFLQQRGFGIDTPPIAAAAHDDDRVARGVGQVGRGVFAGRHLAMMTPRTKRVQSALGIHISARDGKVRRRYRECSMAACAARVAPNPRSRINTANRAGREATLSQLLPPNRLSPTPAS